MSALELEPHAHAIALALQAALRDPDATAASIAAGASSALRLAFPSPSAAGGGGASAAALPRDSASETVAVENALRRTVASLMKDAESAAAAATAALRVVDATSLLFAEKLVGVHMPATLLQLFLMTGGPGLFEDGAVGVRDGVIQCFHAMRKAGVLEGLGKHFITKTVLLFLQRPVVAGQPELVGCMHKELTTVLPAWMKGATNPHGKVDKDNVTLFAVDEELSMVGVDWAVYSSLWGMQRYFSDPSLFQSQNGWNEFCNALTGLLGVLEKTNLSDSASLFGKKRRAAKYLTSQELLNLQLTDLQLRRNVLLQAAIALNWAECSWKGIEDDPIANSDSSWQSKVFARVKKNEPSQGEKLMTHIVKVLDLGSTQPTEGSGVPAGAKSSFMTFVVNSLRLEMPWLEWKKHPSKGRPLNPACGVKQSVGMPVGGDNPKKDVSRLLDGRRLKDDDGVPLFEPGLDMMGPDGDPYRSASMRPIHERDVGGREDRWLPMTPADSLSLLSKNNAAGPDARNGSIEDVIRQDLEDDTELEEEYRNGTNAAYVWQAIRKLCEKQIDSFLKVVEITSSSEAPPFSLKRLLPVEHPVPKRARSGELADGAADTDKGDSAEMHANGAADAADAAMADVLKDVGEALSVGAKEPSLEGETQQRPSEVPERETKMKMKAERKEKAETKAEPHDVATPSPEAARRRAVKLETEVCEK